MRKKESVRAAGKKGGRSLFNPSSPVTVVENRDLVATVNSYRDCITIGVTILRGPIFPAGYPVTLVVTSPQEKEGKFIYSTESDPNDPNGEYNNVVHGSDGGAVLKYSSGCNYCWVNAIPNTPGAYTFKLNEWFIGNHRGEAKIERTVTWPKPAAQPGRKKKRT